MKDSQVWDLYQLISQEWAVKGLYSIDLQDATPEPQPPVVLENCGVKGFIYVTLRRTVLARLTTALNLRVNSQDPAHSPCPDRKTFFSDRIPLGLNNIAWSLLKLLRGMEEHDIQMNPPD